MYAPKSAKIYAEPYAEAVLVWKIMPFCSNYAKNCASTIRQGQAETDKARHSSAKLLAGTMKDRRLSRQTRRLKREKKYKITLNASLLVVIPEAKSFTRVFDCKLYLGLTRSPVTRI